MLRSSLKGGLLAAAAMALALPAYLSPALAQLSGPGAQSPGDAATMDEATPPVAPAPPLPGDPAQPGPGQPGVVPPVLGSAPTLGTPMSPVEPEGTASLHEDGMHGPTAMTEESGARTFSADALLGRSVRGAGGQDLAQIEDILFNGDGEVVHILLSGGELDQTVAITLDELQVSSTDSELEIAMTLDELRQRDAFTEAEGMVALGGSSHADTGAAAPDAAQADQTDDAIATEESGEVRPTDDDDAVGTLDMDARDLGAGDHAAGMEPPESRNDDAIGGAEPPAGDGDGDRGI